MKVSIIQIGNSKGLRLPKTILEQCDLQDEVELEVRGNELVIKSAHTPRENWELSFQSMAEKEDDKLLDLPTTTRWDKTEWEW